MAPIEVMVLGKDISEIFVLSLKAFALMPVTLRVLFLYATLSGMTIFVASLLTSWSTLTVKSVKDVIVYAMPSTSKS